MMQDQTDTNATDLLQRVRAAVTASGRDPEAVLDEVVDLLSRRRRSQETYQKPLG